MGHSVADRTYEHLRGAILAGDLSGGSPLREERIAADLGVSRTPVREALRRLGAEGLVVIDTNRGAQVSSWTERDLDEIYGIRALLEPYGARLAASQASDQELEELVQLYKSMEHAVRSQGPETTMESARLTLVFHKLVLALSGSTRLVSTVASIVAFPVLYRAQASYSSSRLLQGHAEHGMIVQALLDRDPALAEATMRHHILAARAEDRRLFKLHADPAHGSVDPLPR
ncbi:GntR family transcriptional regulator [Microbacterium ulmi]|uniref:GntR family transcriptional regulator n=1 Tax=Microbacterium ulmi TaxID=179095 RepID=A0A7Y2M1F2_9MICO|nr:GntR family transcriptional regulator [Microbacterium ulmi]NII69091.1 DNA-binding GntR family transcriptional regulator [Microbacterium ulmi]NNH04715.1 GntR family transcriptional regulator [Microbacterium ulmi]